MVKSKFAIIIDSAFLSLLISILSISWLRKIIKNAFLFNIFLIFVFVLSFIAIFILSSKKQNKLNLSSKEAKFIENCFLKLSCLDTNNYILYFEKLLNCNHISSFVFKFNDLFLYINLQNELSNKDFISAVDVFLEHKTCDSKLFFIYAKKNKSFDDAVMFSDQKCQVFDHSVLVKIMKENNFYPIKKNENQKIKFSQKAKYYIKTKTSGLTQNHFKEIFFSGLSLLFLSFVVPFSKYYLIMGSILLTLSIISLFRKNIIHSSSDSEFSLK